MRELYSLFVLFLAVILCHISYAQVPETSKDSTTIQKKFLIGGGLDVYYAYNLNKPSFNAIPYYVSMARHNAPSVNLAYLDLKYDSKWIRGRFIPGIGTFISANYAAEPAYLRFPVEANVGVKLSKSKQIWLDAGILSSPYTNESAFSKDHLTYTRSFAPEYVPYYITGGKLSYGVNSRLKLIGYLLNGWQQIIDQNNSLSVGTQVEYKPNDKETFNWNTYIGDERSEARPLFRTRVFTDVYWLHNFNGKFSFAACAYIGMQEVQIAQNKKDDHYWWQLNFSSRYTFKKKQSVVARVEYFSDAQMIQIIPVSGEFGFKCFGTSIGVNFPIDDHALLRFEAKKLLSFDKNEFIGSDQLTSNSSTIFTGNLTFWF
jgi:hypothetical protein